MLLKFKFFLKTFKLLNPTNFKLNFVKCNQIDTNIEFVSDFMFVNNDNYLLQNAFFENIVLKVNFQSYIFYGDFKNIKLSNKIFLLNSTILNKKN